MAGELARPGGPAAGAFGPDTLDRVRQSLQARQAGDADFWGTVGMIELQLYEAMAAGALAEVLGRLVPLYEDLRARVQAPGLWGSVADQATFVLSRWQRGRPQAERRAAEALQKMLQGFAAG